MDLFRRFVETFRGYERGADIRTKKKTKYRKSKGRELRGIRRGMVDVLLSWRLFNIHIDRASSAAPVGGRSLVYFARYIAEYKIQPS